MSFKPNDYNAFLSSLFERGNNGVRRDANASEEGRNLESNSSPFPIDFDFGISMSNAMDNNAEPEKKQSVNVPYSGTEYLAEMNAQNNAADKYNELNQMNYLNLSANNGKKWGMEMNPGLEQGVIENEYRDSLVGELPLSLSPISEVEKVRFKPTKYSSQIDPPLSPLTNPINIRKTTDDLNVDSTNNSETCEHMKERPRQKSAHNVIEQRYRNKINDKFTALQDAVPTLRVAAQKKRDSVNTTSPEKHEDEDYEGDVLLHSTDITDDLEGLEPARKLNKGTILAKSVEYIKFLEMKNVRMRTEHDELILKAKMLGIFIDDEMN